ncbi:MAG TPA: TerC family protein [Methylomirabilota bacterium]|jgi:YjbE family integral membrane protein|nr:TerC family protein [Methylomirabilota bacterium]
MMSLALDPGFWIRLLEIAFLNLLLSGDNAVLIALAVRALPRRQRVLGQIWGTVGAVVLRLAFVGIVSLLLELAFLRVAGALVLLWIAYKLVQPEGGEPERGRHGRSFWHAIWLILVADVTMSLDNVLAIAAAARGDMMLVGIGIAMSVPIVIVGSGVLATLMNRYPAIIWVGGGVLGFVAGEMLLDDPVVLRALGEGLDAKLKVPVAIAMAGTLTAIGWRLSRKKA